jgi:hypothetical protein
VSNAGYSHPSADTKDTTKIRRSPERFLKHISSCASDGEIAEPFSKTFLELQTYCECTSLVLLDVLRKMGVIRGPDRNSFDAEISATHLPAIAECVVLPVPLLNAIRDELIQKVYYASSLKIDDPSKHWHPLNASTEDNPVIQAKRICVDEVGRAIRDRTAPPFRYCNTSSTLTLGAGNGNLALIRRKMIRGGLASQVQTMERRSLSAERKLMELALRKPEELDSLLDQLVGVVKGECDEAYLRASLSGLPVGPKMMDDVYARLHDKAENHSALVFHEPYETLIGVAGLLTGECQIWWSEPFQVTGAE